MIGSPLPYDMFGLRLSVSAAAAENASFFSSLANQLSTVSTSEVPKMPSIAATVGAGLATVHLCPSLSMRDCSHRLPLEYPVAGATVGM